jgi:hypothetical protein
LAEIVLILRKAGRYRHEVRLSLVRDPVALDYPQGSSALVNAAIKFPSDVAMNHPKRLLETAVVNRSSLSGKLRGFLWFFMPAITSLSFMKMRSAQSAM